MPFWSSNPNSLNNSQSIGEKATNETMNLGTVPFVTFMGVVLSRLSYLPDCGFIKRYEQIS